MQKETVLKAEGEENKHRVAAYLIVQLRAHLWRHLFRPPVTWPFRVHVNMLFQAFENLGYAVTHNTAQFPQIRVRKPCRKPWRTTAGSGLHGPVPGGQEACMACQAPPEETCAVELPARLQWAVPHTSPLLPQLQGQPCSSPHQQLSYLDFPKKPPPKHPDHVLLHTQTVKYFSMLEKVIHWLQ